jgi:hypothetical protein
MFRMGGLSYCLGRVLGGIGALGVWNSRNSIYATKLYVWIFVDYEASILYCFLSGTGWRRRWQWYALCQERVLRRSEF